MARMPAKVIAQIHTTSAGLEELFWEWILRVDGQVARRLTAVGGRRERNPWMDVAQLPARDLQALRWDHPRARAVLEGLARRHGHQARQRREQLPTGAPHPARLLQPLAAHAVLSRVRSGMRMVAGDSGAPGSQPHALCRCPGQTALHERAGVEAGCRPCGIHVEGPAPRHRDPVTASTHHRPLKCAKRPAQG